jgi:hypothetical protein
MEKRYGPRLSLEGLQMIEKLQRKSSYQEEPTGFNKTDKIEAEPRQCQKDRN